MGTGKETVRSKKDKMSAAILVGGQSRRMGRDKSQLTYGSVTFLGEIAAKLDDFNEKYLSLNAGQTHTVIGFTNVYDKYDNIGPLGGIYSVLKESTVDYVLFVPCDMPFITRSAINHIVDMWQEEDMLIAMTKSGRQPLVGIYSKRCITAIGELIDKGDYRPAMLLESVRSTICDMTEYEECFANINTIEDYEPLLGTGLGGQNQN